MRNKKLASLLLIAAMVLSLIGTAAAEGEGGLRFGTAGTGGTYYAYGNAISQLLGGEELAFDVRATAGSSANLRLLSEDYIQLAMVQSDTTDSAWNGTGGFEGNPRTGYSAVASLYSEHCQIVATAASGIKTVEDLVGKRVSVGADESGVVTNAEQILGAYGVTFDMLQTEYMSFSDSADAMAAGKLDAFFCTAGAPTNAVANLARSTDIVLVPQDADKIARLTDQFGAYASVTIPAGTYAGQTEDVAAVAVRALLVASDKLSAEQVYAITSGLFANADAIQNATPADTPLVLEQATDGVTIPFHPGAAQFYGEKGIAVTSVAEVVAPEPEPEAPSIKVLKLDMYQTLAVAVLILFLGAFLRKKIQLLEVFCIPAPVVGGLVFAILTCVLHGFGILEFSFDETLRTVCMVIFFTSVGFQANLKVLKSGGIALVIFLGLVVVLIAAQNGLAMGISTLLGVDPLVGMCTGSIPMVGGHGTAGAFGPVMEDLGLSSATTLATAAATFGLIGGSLMGGPLGRRLIEKHDLVKTAVPVDENRTLADNGAAEGKKESKYPAAAYQLALAMGIGSVVSIFLTKTGLTFPAYIGAMIVAAVIRNVGEFSGKFTVYMDEIDDIGGLCLSMFLGVAMITLKLWQLAELALPLVILLVCQALLMALYANFVVFNVMGRNYDAAVLAAGCCGFGMGATPNAMANMQALTQRYVPSVKAFLLVPLVGSLFADFFNAMIITFFINLV